MTFVVPRPAPSRPHPPDHYGPDDGQLIIVGPPPGRYVLACADCKRLTDLDDLAWRCDTPINVVSTIVCRRCAP